MAATLQTTNANGSGSSGPLAPALVTASPKPNGNSSIIIVTAPSATENNKLLFSSPPTDTPLANSTPTSSIASHTSSANSSTATSPASTTERTLTPGSAGAGAHTLSAPVLHNSIPPSPSFGASPTGQSTQFLPPNTQHYQHYSPPHQPLSAPISNNSSGDISPRPEGVGKVDSSYEIKESALTGTGSGIGMSMDGSNLIVNYLPTAYTDDTLRSMFRAYGTVAQCKVVRDKKSGQSLGYGFVKFDRPESASKAVAGLNGFVIENKKLKVALSKPPTAREDQKRNLYISGLPLSYGIPELSNLLAPFGAITEVRVLLEGNTNTSRGVGFVILDHYANAQRAIDALHGRVLDGATKKLVVKFADKNTQIRAPLFVPLNGKKVEAQNAQSAPAQAPAPAPAHSQQQHFSQTGSPNGSPAGSHSPNFNHSLPPTHPSYQPQPMALPSQHMPHYPYTPQHVGYAAGYPQQTTQYAQRVEPLMQHQPSQPPQPLYAVTAPVYHTLHHHHHQQQQAAAAAAVQTASQQTTTATATTSTTANSTNAGSTTSTPAASQHSAPSQPVPSTAASYSPISPVQMSHTPPPSISMVPHASPHHHQMMYHQMQYHPNHYHYTTSAQYSQQMPVYPMYQHQQQQANSNSGSGSVSPAPQSGASATTPTAASGAAGGGAAASTNTQTSHSSSSGENVSPRTMQAVLAQSAQFVGVCLFVYHLPNDFSESSLASLFTPYCDVYTAKVMRDLHTGNSKGFGFVNVPSREVAEYVMSRVDGMQIGTKFLKVSIKNQNK